MVGRGGGGSWSLKTAQNWFIPEQISVSTQSWLSAIVRYNLAIIGCLSHLETPTQLKSPPYLLQLNLGGITCRRSSTCYHSLALFNPPLPPSPMVELSLSCFVSLLNPLLPPGHRSFPSSGFVPRFLVTFLLVSL